ncbi:Aminopeptidase N, partial [Gryllus bimaculatus]
RYVSRLIDRAYSSLSLTFSKNEAPNRHDEKLLMNRLGSWACSVDVESCTNHAVLRLQLFLDAFQSVNPDQRSVVYCHGIHNSHSMYWDKLWSVYQSSDDDVERGLIIGGLACSRDQRRLSELLKLSIAGGDIRKQDASTVFSAVYSKPLGVDVALDFLNDNFEQVSQYFGSVNNILNGIAGRM